jgi:hypothetical protein
MFQHGNVVLVDEHFQEIRSAGFNLFVKGQICGPGRILDQLFRLGCDR